MSTADQLLEGIFSWIEKKERCADNLVKLAQELESLREKCNVTECAGNSVTVLGCAFMIGAGVATVLTEGLATPLLSLAATYTGLGVAVSVGAKITEHFLSSDTLKEAQKAEKESNEIHQNIQKHFEKLKKEVNSFADLEELDQHIDAEILTAIAQRKGLKVKLVNASLCGVVLGTSVNTFSSIKQKGATKLMDIGFRPFITHGLRTGFYDALVVSGAATVGGGVGMVFAVREAIGTWTDLIKNNHVTEASKSLRDTADNIRKETRTLKEYFNSFTIRLEEMAKHQQESDECSSEEETQEKTKEADTESLSQELQDCIESIIMSYISNNPKRRWALLNIRSIKSKCKNRKIKKKEWLVNLLKQIDIDVLIITETWLNTEDDLGEDLPPNYSFYQWARQGRGGGVAIIFSNERLKGTQIDLTPKESQKEQGQKSKPFEHVAVKLQHNDWNQPVLVIAVYRQPRGDLNEFLDELKMLLKEASAHCSHILLAGDFNIWVDDKSQTSTKKFDNMLKELNLVQHVGGPTHQQGHTLDLVISSRNVEVSDLTDWNSRVSDHSTVYFNVKPGNDEDEEEKEL